MADLDGTVINQRRREMALRTMEPLLNVAHLTPPGKDLETFYQCVWQKIGPATPVLYLEFGVFEGRSMFQFSRAFHNQNSEFFGFDSFEGLPEEWGDFARGAFSTAGAAPNFDDPRINFVKGWFQNTVPDRIPALRDRYESTKLVHFDADLYSSTLFLLTTLWHYIPEYFFIFDEFGYDEVVALQDFAVAYPVKFEFFAKTEGPMQVFGSMKRTALTIV